MIIRWPNILFRILILACHFIFDILANPLVLGIKIKVVNHIIVTDFIPLILTQVLTVVLKDIVRAHWELGWAWSSLLLSDELFLLWILASTYYSHALLWRGWIRFVLAESIVYSLLMVHNVVNINGLKLTWRCRRLKVIIVTFISRFVLRALSFLTGLEHLSWVTIIVVDWRATSYWWERLLWVKLNIVHLKISFWGWSLNKTSSNSSGISNWLRHPNIWDLKFIISCLGLWRPKLIHILPIRIEIRINC